MPAADRLSTPEDRRILERTLAAREGGETRLDGGGLLARLGLRFLGAPYEAATLEGKGPGEPLVINLRAFDCFTFVESMTALTLAVRSGGAPCDAFAGWLERLRYRRGIRRGYASRLHYFTDWLGDNRRLGVLRDVTRELGGLPDRRAVRFMTDHPGMYPPLADAAQRAEVRRAERNLSRRLRYRLPSDMLGEVETRFRDGDIIGIAAARPGLDVIHAGLAVRKDGRVHLLHASGPAGGVVLTEEPLCRYVAGRRDAAGIVAGRLKDPRAPLPRGKGTGGPQAG
jgi:hypothetical protein